MKASKWWKFKPVHPSAWSVVFWFLAANFVASRYCFAAVGIKRLVRTFRDGDRAEGRKSWTKSIHSGLSTHESGKPAETVSLAILSSNFLWNPTGHMLATGSLIEMDCDRDLGVALPVR